MINRIKKLSEGSELSSAMIFSVLYSLGTMKAAGRARLAKTIGLSEHLVRKSIKLLISEGLLHKEDSRYTVASTAKDTLNRIVLKEAFNLRNLYGWPRTIVFHLKDFCLEDLNTRTALNIRDAVISWGGLGAVVLQIVGGQVQIPGIEDIEEKENIISALRIEMENLQDGLYVIIGSEFNASEHAIMYGILNKICLTHRQF